MAAAYRKHTAAEAQALELDQVASEIEESGVVPPFELGPDRTAEGSDGGTRAEPTRVIPP
jgi:hypothetical protein